MLTVCSNSSWLLLVGLWARVRPHQDLVLENMLLRHQLAVLTRPTRTRPLAQLRTWDKLVWCSLGGSLRVGVSS
jgi:hypothetical protein